MSKPRRNFNAYIDEAGDEGFTRLGWRTRGIEQASSEWIVFGAVLVHEEYDAERMRVVDELRELVGKTRSKKPLHWRNLRNDHKKKRLAMDLLARQPLVFSAVALYKPALANRAPALRNRKGFLYNWGARLLVERLSWFADRSGRGLNLLFENRANTSYTDLRRYVRTLASDGDDGIVPGSINDVRPVSPTWKGAQVADFFVSAAAEALEPDLDGYTEPDYLQRISKKLYRPTGKEILKYGFKVFPPEAVDHDRYPWLRDL